MDTHALSVSTLAGALEDRQPMASKRRSEQGPNMRRVPALQDGPIRNLVQDYICNKFSKSKKLKERPNRQVSKREKMKKNSANPKAHSIGLDAAAGAVRAAFGLVWTIDAYLKFQPGFLTGYMDVHLGRNL